MVWFTRV